ncbi:PAS domain-containing hybrid sensor histidine kinase/response regulator [Photobacterium sp. Alg240-V54]|uniref:PAS domain-containing hybrid sensor histidine kinase/response regulator n=1 Tax=Photobacterium sp. Alg240-V54 TaxID=2305995 RepID=UPI0013D07EEF|nr:PAS domain-containing hybrid sensor histidine kinase/response regulator [Photobacterium sp. Alg240-V54]
MTQGWLVITALVVYIGVLVAIAWYGDKKPQWLASKRSWIYSLSIAVYCSSWTFYGTVGQASANIWSFLPIYLAPIIMFTFGWRIWARLIVIAKREHITSIADFIAARYGKSSGLAVCVTLIAVVGVLPYIALQLRGITIGVEYIAPELHHQFGLSSINIALMVACGLAIFTIFCGTRHIDSTEHHRGMMMAIAFESVVKLVAFLVIGFFALMLLKEQPQQAASGLQALASKPFNGGSFSIHLLLTMAAILCLPRQFHTIVVENNHPSDLHRARWVFPLYLLFMACLVVPLAVAGQQWLEGFPAESYVINLPLQQGIAPLALLAFIGGTSAAMAMVIVSTVALASMISNDVVLPLLLRRLKVANRHFDAFSGLLLTIRRVLIGGLLVAAWGVYIVVANVESLSGIGLLSFAAIAQFSPALLGGLYWHSGNKKGVYCGLFGGITVWLLVMFNQADILTGSVISKVIFEILTPPQYAFLEQLNRADWGMLLSLLVNLSLYIGVSLATRSSLTERMQAATFVGIPLVTAENEQLYQTRVTVVELEMLAAKFVGQQRVRQAFLQFSIQQQCQLIPHQQASPAMILHTERVLAGVFGSSSARLVLTSALQGRHMQLEDVATIVDEASEMFDFSRGLLQGAIEHISQGIAVVDKQLRLVAWNQRYLELFTFPAGLIQVGRPIAEVIRYNAQQGLCGEGDPEQHVAKRIQHLQQRTPHTSSRVRADGQVIEVQGNPMPGGGFVMSFSNITVFRQAEAALKESNENLEARVKKRTQQLEHLNQQLVVATQQAESQARSKSRFLAAVSHDLMQPLNAARLFSSSLVEVSEDQQSARLASHITSALSAAEDLIGDLLDVSRLEAGKLAAHIVPLRVSDVLSVLQAEFGVLAVQQQIDFKVVMSDAVILSDSKLLRRALQNFLTNAFRYNPKGRVLLGIRRRGDRLLIEVWDNGPGIPVEKQADIFDEFTRMDQTGADHGLGLGLAIARGISRVLDHPLGLRSWPQHGTVFSLAVGRCSPSMLALKTSPLSNTSGVSLAGLKVLCIDNEAHILVAMTTLLEQWHCEVRIAENKPQALQQLVDGWQPDAILSDYHLAKQQTGLDILLWCRSQLGAHFKGVVISADRLTEHQLLMRQHGFSFLAKPVKPLKLRAILNHCLTKIK